jgi:hypothetical protein
LSHPLSESEIGALCSRQHEQSPQTDELLLVDEDDEEELLLDDEDDEEELLLDDEDDEEELPVQSCCRLIPSEL